MIASECRTVVPKALFTQSSFPMDLVGSFTTGFAQADEELKSVNEKSGSTCVIAVVLNNTLMVGNVGDSEAVLAYKVGEELRFTILTHKHSVSDPREIKRIEKVGDVIVGDRIMGSLSVARAFGDFMYKANGKEYVSVEPHVCGRALHPQDQFLVLGCDGLWEAFSFREVVGLVNIMRKQGKEPNEVAETIANMAIKRGSEDNVTVVIVYFEWEGQPVVASPTEPTQKKPSEKQEPEPEPEPEKSPVADDEAKGDAPTEKKQHHRHKSSHKDHH